MVMAAAINKIKMCRNRRINNDDGYSIIPMLVGVGIGFVIAYKYGDAVVRLFEGCRSF
jgi:hypothetical protein